MYKDMTKLSNEQEEIENFLSDYILQVRTMSILSDTEIKLVMRKLMEESPEWFWTLMERYRKKQLTKMMQDIAKDVHKDPIGYARKVT